MCKFLCGLQSSSADRRQDTVSEKVSRTPDFVLPSFFEYDIPPAPNLEDPRAYAIWRRECIDTKRIPRAVLVDYLETLDQPIAFIRAAMILGYREDVRARTDELLTRPLVSGSRATFLFAKCLVAHFRASEAYSSTTENPETVSLGTSNVLKGILEELACVSNWTLLHFELEVRTHLALSESEGLSRNFDRVIRHAGEVLVLAPKIGMRHLVADANYQIADASFRSGNVREAELYFDEVIGSSFAGHRTIQNATVYRALCRYWLGDESGTLSALGNLDSDVQADFSWITQLTLRTQHPSDRSAVAADNGLAQALSIFSRAALAAQSLSPEHADRIAQIYQTANRTLKESRFAFSVGWFSTLKTYLEAYTAMRSGIQNFPGTLDFPKNLDGVAELPPSARAFAYSVFIEATAILHAPSSSLDFLSTALDGLVTTLSKLDDEVQLQVARKLQLLSPFGLALASCWDGIPAFLLDLGSDCVMDLGCRPIKVFGTAALSPMHAVRFTLSAFGREDLAPLSRGGPQMRSLEKSLRHPYFDRLAWFEPVAPAKMIITLLRARDRVNKDQKVESSRFQRAATNVVRAFGICPSSPQFEHNPILVELEKVVMNGLKTDLDLDRLSSLIG
jgi:hypothetical protein